MTDRFSKTKRYKPMDMKMFEPTACSDEGSLAVALGILELNLLNPAVDKHCLIEQLSEIPRLLEFVFSALPSLGFQCLVDWVSQCFPDSPQTFECSIFPRLISRLALYCGGLPLRLPELDECHRAVELAPPALKELAVLWSANEPVDAVVEDTAAKGKSKKVSQRITKKAKRAEQLPKVNMTVFARIDEDVPQSKEEAVMLAQRILTDQLGVLKNYLDVLRRPELSGVIKSNYVDIEDAPKSPIVESGEVANIGFPGIIHQPQLEAMLDYPSQPTPSALFFASAEGFGEWRVMMAQRVVKYLEETHRKNPPAFDIALKKMRELSHGHFSADNQKRLVGSDNGLPIFEAKMSRDARLVYRIDCVQEMGSQVEIQVLRLYGIFTHAEMGRKTFWSAMSQAVAGANSEYRKRCLYRNPAQHAGDDSVSPASWPPMEDIVESALVDLPDLTNKDKQELRSMSDLDKLTPCSQALLSSIAANEDPSHPFHLSRSEQTVVVHPGSSFVLGRSGTGKTTTMMFKMVLIERSWRLRHAAEETTAPPPRQVFITQSPILADKAQDYHRKVIRTVEAETRSLAESEGLAVTTNEKIKSGLYDKDEAEEYREDLPKKFSELKAHHFPLFITFHRLCRLLEADVAEQDKDMRRRLWPTIGPTLDIGEDDILTSNDYMLQRRDFFVSYNVFLEEYWRHFPQNLTKGLNPASVFAEFMGVIRGSEQALRTKEGYLDRSVYCGLSHRIGTLHASKENVYSLFEAYIKRKMLRREYDAADRTQMILQSIRKHGLFGDKVDFVYVDEVQDNLLIDTLVLRAICRRPTGFFWAGDTAQTISAGSSFRFDDLPALMYRVEREMNTHNPRTFYLDRNFRSQGGIVKCAQTILDTIVGLWPYAVDAIAAEKGMLDGQKPLFIGGGEFDIPHFEQFVCPVDSESGPGNAIEFGDQQCIIVRNDAARDRLRAKFGHVGVIMTLYETKGLEFEDVLLYNFFTDSTVSAAQWRVVLNGLDVRSPIFDEEKHNGVCHELKCLYVASTRARLNLWIVDYSGKGEPMRLLWESRKQVETWVPGARIPVLAQSESSPEKWASTAERLFHVAKNYGEAMVAYGRAGERFSKQRAAAEAFHLRDLARREAANPRRKETQRAEAYIRAARALQRVAEDDDDDDARKANFRSAADCFLRARDEGGAARCFEQVPDFTRAAKCYRAVGSFDDAVRIIKTCEVDVAVKEHVEQISAVHYIKHNQVSKAEALLGSEEKVLECADLFGLDRERASLLERLGRIDEAAELHLQNGHLAEAIRLSLMPKLLCFNCADQILQSFMDEFWAVTSLGHVLTSGTQSESLRTMAHQLLRSRWYSVAACDLLSMPALLTSSNTSRLLRHGLKLIDVDQAAALLCLDHAFRDPPQIEAANASDVVEYLRSFLTFLQGLRSLIFRPNLCASVDLRRLLAVVPLDSGHFLVRPDSVLHPAAKPATARTAVRLTPRDLEFAMKEVVKNRILELVRRENEACKSSQAFSVCLQYAIEGRCTMKECQSSHVLSYSHSEYQLRVAVHGLQIRIYSVLEGIESWGERQNQQRFWLSSLNETLQPAITKLGAWYNVDDGSLAPEAKRIISYWLCEGLFCLRTNPGSPIKIPFFLNTFFRSCFLNKLVSGTYIPHYVCRIPTVVGPNGDWLSRGKEQVDIIQDALRLLGNDPQSLSSGILMVRHIITQELPIQVGLLCDILDVLSPMLVLAARGSRLHTLTFPRSWYARLMGSFDGSIPRDTDILWLYVQPMAVLLEQMYSQAGHLRLKALHGGSQALFALRNMYILRICQNLCLFGYNIRNDHLRANIVKTLNSLQKLHTASEGNMYPLPRIYRRYATAETWSQLAQCVKENALGGDVDFLIELVHADRSRSMPPSTRGIRRVVYHIPADVPRLLNVDRMLTGDVPGFEHTSLPQEPTGTSNHTPHELQGNPEIDTDIDHIGTGDPESVTFAGVKAARPTSSYSDDDYQTIRTALSIYRRTHARARLNSKARTTSKASLLQARAFKACLTEAKEIDWADRRAYRLVFLWYLPHVLGSLQGILASLHQRKTHFKKQLAEPSVDHLAYDDLMDRITADNDRMKHIHGLLKELSPSAEYHGRQDRMEYLRSIAKKVQTLLLDLPISIKQQWDSGMSVGLKGLLTADTVVKPQKPMLNWEDDLDLWDV